MDFPVLLLIGFFFSPIAWLFIRSWALDLCIPVQRAGNFSETSIIPAISPLFLEAHFIPKEVFLLFFFFFTDILGWLYYWDSLLCA